MCPFYVYLRWSGLLFIIKETCWRGAQWKLISTISLLISSVIHRCMQIQNTLVFFVINEVCFSKEGEHLGHVHTENGYALEIAQRLRCLLWMCSWWGNFSWQYFTWSNFIHLFQYIFAVPYMGPDLLSVWQKYLLFVFNRTLLETEHAQLPLIKY